MSPVVCSCGLAHSPAEWLKLPLVGIQRFDGEALELRNCPCGSTRAVAIVEADGPTIDACARCTIVDELRAVGDVPACSFCAEMLRGQVAA